MNFKKNKSARTFFIYGLFLGLIIGLTLSLLGVPQVVGNSIKAKELNFNKQISIDEKNRVATIEVSGALDPNSRTFDKDFDLLYNFAINEVEKIINEKGMVDCETKQPLTDSEKSIQINQLRSVGSKNQLKAYLITDQLMKVNYLEELEKLNKEEIEFSEKEKEDILYFACPPDCDITDPPAGDTGDGDWWDPYIPDLPENPINCSSCGGGSGVCLGSSTCGGGNVDIDGCIIEGQEVLLESGEHKSVEKLSIGDKVISYNLETKQMEVDEITYKAVNVPNDYYRINEKLELTQDHRIYVVNKGFIEVKDIIVDEDYIFENGNNILVTSKEFVKNRDKRIYSFSVKNNQNFLVNDILVHNDRLHITKPEITGWRIKITIHF